MSFVICDRCHLLYVTSVICYMWHDTGNGFHVYVDSHDLEQPGILQSGLRATHCAAETLIYRMWTVKLSDQTAQIHRLVKSYVVSIWRKTFASCSKIKVDVLYLFNAAFVCTLCLNLFMIDIPYVTILSSQYYFSVFLVICITYALWDTQTRNTMK